MLPKQSLQPQYRCGLIGSPISHSLSPAIHHASFECLGIDGSYELLPTDLDELRLRLDQCQDAGFHGLNVTMPLKQSIVALLDDLTPSARLSHSVNTVLFTDGKRIGHSTDGDGILQPLRDLGIDLDHIKLAILGSGGAGAAAVVAASRAGIAQITLLNRPGPGLERAYRHAGQIAADPLNSSTIDVVPLEAGGSSPAAIANADVIVNCTPVGMAPALTELSPIPSQWLSEHHVIVDAVYWPEDTLLLREARSAGAQTVSGIKMLVAQAMLAEEFWFDCVLSAQHRIAVESNFRNFLA
ncbi:shikimate dehydrogenase family protein [Arcanobacterium pinnipediorum]|uniref:Shikimate dehydrogenase (NADP(+)) n=1 Tax=Arcanobacterium pinnipediorum TaxID=1503041 RepID=A0ABY5AEN8_9ACTO|nr:shikimate dehydrogenase [Arcanobacterium pinnipediorum]USR78677.1 shikimate dehydrogenase [Arcanobacterium pinnipediorum]